MMIEMWDTIVNILCTRKGKEKYYRMVSGLKLDSFKNRTIGYINDYFNEHQSVNLITKDIFLTWCMTTNRINKAEIMDFSDAIKRKVPVTTIDDDEHEGLMKALTQEQYAQKLQLILDGYKKGAVFNLYTETKMASDSYDDILRRKNNLQAIEVDIDDLLEEKQGVGGYEFKTPCLREAIISCVGGEFFTLAGPSDNGKTSILAFEMVNFAQQMPEDECILWLNNEGKGSSIVGRIWNAALCATDQELSKKKSDGVFEKELSYALNGNYRRKIQVYDIHGINTLDIEALIEREKPRFVVFDMIDNINFAGDIRHGGSRTDEVLENLYQWAREKAVTENFTCFATSQVSIEGYREQWPTGDMLKGSKVGKQAASQVIIMIAHGGNKDSNVRYISTPKNKLPRLGKDNVKGIMYFDKPRCNFTEKMNEIKPTTQNLIDDIEF